MPAGTDLGTLLASHGVALQAGFGELCSSQYDAIGWSLCGKGGFGRTIRLLAADTLQARAMEFRERLADACMLHARIPRSRGWKPFV